MFHTAHVVHVIRAVVHFVQGIRACTHRLEQGRRSALSVAARCNTLLSVSIDSSWLDNSNWLDYFEFELVHYVTSIEETVI